jgi:transglutaminase-like putative cysteine protease
LLGSRYCEVDLLSQAAWDLFGETPEGYARAKAICNWVHSHIEFGYPHARCTRTALEAFNEKQGVCRDYTHLAITLCRCMNIPARYCTGYLGDIRVPVLPGDMDFSAWLEVYVGGRWYALDARHNQRRLGRVLMARGRDAVDVALTTSYGPSQLIKFWVQTEEIIAAPVRAS